MNIDTTTTRTVTITLTPEDIVTLQAEYDHTDCTRTLRIPNLDAIFVQLGISI